MTNVTHTQQKLRAVKSVVQILCHQPVVSYRIKYHVIICIVLDQHIHWTTKVILWQKFMNPDRFKVIYCNSPCICFRIGIEVVYLFCSYDACVPWFLHLSSRYLQTFSCKPWWTKRFSFHTFNWMGWRTKWLWCHQILGQFRKMIESLPDIFRLISNFYNFFLFIFSRLPQIHGGNGGERMDIFAFYEAQTNVKLKTMS